MFRSISAVAIVAVAASAAAAASGPLQITSQVLAEQRVRAADGSISKALAPAKKVVPGDRVVFVLNWRNTGQQALANVVLDNPVPRGIAYRGPAPKSPAPELSVDGKTWGTLASLRVPVAGGSRAATPDDITHVRWRLAPLAPGAQGQVAFEGVLK